MTTRQVSTWVVWLKKDKITKECGRKEMAICENGDWKRRKGRNKQTNQQKKKMNGTCLLAITPPEGPKNEWNIYINDKGVKKVKSWQMLNQNKERKTENERMEHYL